MKEVRVSKLSQPEPIMHMKSITHQNVLSSPLKISIKIQLS